MTYIRHNAITSINHDFLSIFTLGIKVSGSFTKKWKIVFKTVLAILSRSNVIKRHLIDDCIIERWNYRYFQFSASFLFAGNTTSGLQFKWSLMPMIQNINSRSAQFSYSIRIQIQYYSPEQQMDFMNIFADENRAYLKINNVRDNGLASLGGPSSFNQ